MRNHPSGKAGPDVRISASCAECRYCDSESETVEDGNDSDTSWDIYCTFENPAKRVGNSWTTPKWCPFYDHAIGAKVREELGKPSW